MGEDGMEGQGHREASAWMVALQERPDDTVLRERFETWRLSGSNHAAWRDLERVSGLIRQAPRNPIPIAMPAGMIRRPRRSAWKPGALSAAAFCGALLIGGDVLPSNGAAVTTDTGESREIRLADGSRVTLAPRSSVVLAGGATDRVVRLSYGAAFFDVAHDDARPFRVVAGDVVASDLGTAFEVVRDGSVTRIAVRDGVVATSCRNDGVAPAVLRAGEMQAIDCRAGIHRRGHVAPIAVASWTTGRLVATDRSLGDVVAALRPWHAGWLIARGRGMERRVTGVYDLRDPDRALAAIATAHRVTIKKITPWFTILSAD